MKRFLLAFIYLLFYAAAQAQSDTPYVIMVSFDGFRYDYVQKYQPSNFKKFISKGAASEGLIPSFPSKTFPNHYTLVTGLYPGHHGLVDNQFYDPTSRKSYGMKDKQAVHDTSFYGGVPLWQLARKNGLKSASFFWVGSETAIQGVTPDYYFQYDQSVSNTRRIDQTIAWLALPEADRPHYISLYFSLVDTEGHNTGPRSAQLISSVMTSDSIVGDLMTRVRATNLPVNVILVSDHGMYELKQQERTYIILQNLFDVDNRELTIASGGTQVHLYTSKADSLFEIIKPKEQNFKIYRRNEFPARWHYDIPRAGDLMLVADPGYYFRDKALNFGMLNSAPFGVHGYDPTIVKDMQGIFYAQGPNIRRGVTIKAFENIHVYPLVAKILGLPVQNIDGDIKVLESIYKK